MESQAATYLFQQGVAVVTLAAVGAAFALAIRKLFADAKTDRDTAAAALAAAHMAGAAALAQAHDECRVERAQDRAEWLSQFEKQGLHLGTLATSVDANTRATERLTDRLAGSAIKAAVVLLLAFYTLSACAHPPPPQARAAASVAEAVDAGAAVAVAVASQAQSAVAVAWHRGARHFRAAFAPPLDGGAPVFSVELDDAPEDLTDQATSAADAGAIAAADAGASAQGEAEAGALLSVAAPPQARRFWTWGRAALALGALAALAVGAAVRFSPAGRVGSFFLAALRRISGG